MLTAFIFYSALFLVLLLLPATMILAVLLLLKQGRQLRQRATPVLAPVGQMLARSTGVASLRTRFPITARLLVHRFDPRNPWGLSATLAALVIGAGVWFFLGVLQDIAAKDPLVVLDLRVHNAVPMFRTPGMTRFMVLVTELGGALCLGLLCLGTAFLALARHQARIAATFLLALAATALLTVGLKALFASARPADAIIAIGQGSFPSGHLLSATVVYGLLAALLLESNARNSLRALGVTALVLVIVGIGWSRLYLGVHWPSDLLGSLALALMALAASLFFLNYPARLRWIDGFTLPPGPRACRAAGLTLVCLAAGAAAVLATQARFVPTAPVAAALPIDIALLRHALPAGMPRWSDDLVGGPMEPVSLVLVGSEGELLEVFSRAGWDRADAPTPVRVLQEGIAALRNLPDPTGPATPAFFMDQPQRLTFEKPDSTTPSIRRRHHTRLWPTPYCIEPACRPVWVATASFDVDVEFSPRSHLPTHRIDPAIDMERALIAADLTAAGARLESIVALTPASRGTNAIGDPFWTDGRALLVVLP